MTDDMNGLLAEAKKNKYSGIKDNLSEEDIGAVWDNVSSYIEKQMSQQKGVQIQSLGTFTFTQKKLDIGNNKFILIQRPVFNISEKLAQSQALQYVKNHVPGTIPVTQLNFAALSFESPFDRDTVETCVREILNAVQRAIGARRNVELNFNGIGKLSIRDSKVKMKFFKDFINQMDGSGKLLDSLQNRPGTVDSVMSDRSMMRPHSSNTVILPKISSTTLNPNGGLPPLQEQMEEMMVENLSEEPPVQNMDMDYPIPDTSPAHEVRFMPPPMYTTQEGMEGTDFEDVDTAAAIRNINMEGDGPTLGQAGPIDTLQTYGMMETEPKSDATRKASIPPSRTGSRMAVPMAMATGVSILDDLVPSAMSPKSAPSPNQRQGQIQHEGFQRPYPPTHLAPMHRSYSLDEMKPGDKVNTPPSTACGHSNAGQELCYLCHQRGRRNIPVSFSDERKRRENEEDRLLQQYQYMKDAENVLGEQEMNMAKRHNLQKMAAFNLGVSEAVHQKKHSRDTDFHRSYIFQRRPLTPPRFFKQEEYSGDLAKQVVEKESSKNQRRTDEDFLERLEQVQLAEDLAVQRELFLQEKSEEQDKYKKALDSQIQNQFYLMKRMRQHTPLSKSPLSYTPPLRLPYLSQSKTIRPFSDESSARMNEDWKPLFARLRFKPLQVPAREPDHEVFGKDDMTNEKMAERRRRAYDMFKDQQDLVAQRKRENILKRLSEQKEEEQVLDSTKNDICDDRANRFNRRMHARKRVEDDWTRAVMLKQDRLKEDHIRALSPGMLLHEQCDKYNRCAQCKRVVRNCGESNLWSESRYIPGSRLMV